MNICKVLTVAGADQEEVVKAIENSDFKDFEDCLQDRCAVSVAADYIVTRNVKDFATAETKAITPKEFCELMENAKAKHNSEYMEMLDRGFKEIDSGSRGTTKTMDELRAMEHE